jgi:hypothetical protein
MAGICELSLLSLSPGRAGTKIGLPGVDGGGQNPSSKVLNSASHGVQNVS